MRPRDAQAHGPSALAIRSGPPQPQDMPDLILLIDDDAVRLATLRDCLTTDDMTPVIARGVPDALWELEHGMKPDAIVIDLDMHDGFVALARIECATEDLVPVVALSKRPRRLIEAGIADAVVMKPFEIGHLRSSVGRARERHRGAS